MKVYNAFIMVISILLSIYIAVFDGLVGNGVIAIFAIILLVCVFLDFCLSNIRHYKLAINLLILITFSISVGFLKNRRIDDEILFLKKKNNINIKKAKDLNLKYISIINGDRCTYLVYKKYSILSSLLTDDNKTKICIQKENLKEHHPNQ